MLAEVLSWLNWGGTRGSPGFRTQLAFAPLGCHPGFLASFLHTGGRFLLIEIPQTSPKPWASQQVGEGAASSQGWPRGEQGKQSSKQKKAAQHIGRCTLGLLVAFHLHTKSNVQVLEGTAAGPGW